MRTFVRALLLSALLPVAASASTVTYNVATDFSIANGNPNSVWTYGYGTTDANHSLTSFTAFSTSGSNFSDSYAGNYGFNYWSTSANGFPVVGHNPNSGTGISHGSISVPANELFMHPSNTGQDAIVVFTAPVDGDYTVDGYFARRDTSDGSGDGTFDSIYLDGIFMGGTASGTTYGTIFPFSSQGIISLLAGETIALDVNNNGTFGSDSTGLSLSITGPAVTPAATPEPSSLALLGTGVLGVAGFARRKFLRA